MKKNWFCLLVIAAVAVCPMVGCGGSDEPTVVEAPTDTTDDGSAMDGMSDDEYNDAMNEQNSQ